MTAPMTRRPAPILFACFFAAQSGYLALTPVLTDVAGAFDVSTAAAGQVRTVAAVVAVATAILAGTVGRRAPRRKLLLVALALTALGAATSAVAPSILVLGLGQCLIGAGSATVTAAGVAAAAEWSDERGRGRVVAWAIVGAPTAWVVTMPVIGALASIAWRLAFAAPVVAAASAAVALRHAPRAAPAEPALAVANGTARRGLPRWATGEILFSSAFGGTLAYAGALLVDSYGLSPTAVGLALGAGAAAYIPGTFAAKAARESAARPLLAVAALVLAALVTGFGVWRAGALVSTLGFAALCFVAGARQYLGSMVGLSLSGDRNTAMAVRAAAGQGGWIVGAAAGGAALATAGYPGLGVVLGGLFAASALPYAAPLVRSIRSRLRAPATLLPAHQPAAARAPGYRTEAPSRRRGRGPSTRPAPHPARHGP
jgi:MFS transporter, DHA1 family, inner membrane transport protein